jgi:hypothetical protein
MDIWLSLNDELLSYSLGNSLRKAEIFLGGKNSVECFLPLLGVIGFSY